MTRQAIAAGQSHAACARLTLGLGGDEKLIVRDVITGGLGGFTGPGTKIVAGIG